MSRSQAAGNGLGEVETDVAAPHCPAGEGRGDPEGVVIGCCQAADKGGEVAVDVVQIYGVNGHGAASSKLLSHDYREFTDYQQNRINPFGPYTDFAAFVSISASARAAMTSRGGRSWKMPYPAPCHTSTPRRKT